MSRDDLRLTAFRLSAKPLKAGGEMVVLARTAAETQKPLIFVYSLQHIRCDLWIADCFIA